MSQMQIQQDQQQQQRSNVLNQPILNVPTQLSGKIAEFIAVVQPEGAPFINPTDIISQTNAMEAKEFIQQQLKKPLGPDHINTLEQLKIELENITHVHMMNKLLAENDAGQLSPGEMAEMNQLPDDGGKCGLFYVILMLVSHSVKIIHSFLFLVNRSSEYGKLYTG